MTSPENPPLAPARQTVDCAVFLLQVLLKPEPKRNNLIESPLFFLSISSTLEPVSFLTQLRWSTLRGSLQLQSGRYPRLYGIGKAQTYHHSIPFVAHKRLTDVSPPAHSVRVRPSVILAEIDRIHHKVRPSLAYQPAEDYLNSRSAVSFDDETRSIRAQTAALLKRIHEPLPRATRIFPISATRYQEPPIPERITSDAYIHRLLGSTHNVRQEILSMSHYDEPAKRLMGKGHLACVSFAGGRAFPRRKNLFYDDDRVKNDVKYLSMYKKNIDAAAKPSSAEAAALSAEWFRSPASYITPPRTRPISRFYRPAHVPDDNLSYYEPPVMPVKKTASSRSQSQPTVETPTSIPKIQRQTSLKEEPLGEEEFEDTAARMNRRKKKKQEEARLAEEEDKKQESVRQTELARQEKLALEASAVRQKELEKKAELAKQAEEEAARKAEAERQEAERKAELERQKAERKAEAERQAELERQEAESKAEAERQAELERQEAERKAELERQEAERKVEAERQAELERQEAELERQEAERKAEEERQAQLKLEEELAKQEAEAMESAAAEEAPAAGTEDTETIPKDEPKTEAPTEDVSAAPAEETSTAPVEETTEAPAEDKSVEIVPTSTTAEEESGTEPVVEEPLSPVIQQESTKGTTIEEVHDVGISEEPEEE